MDDTDVALRNATYGLFVELGRAPTPNEVAGVMESSPSQVRAGWERLHGDHALVLQPHTSEIRMANPFSAVPTPHRVIAAGRTWFANCAWDAFGVCAALRTDGRVETSCADCGETLTIELADTRPDDDSLLFHCLVPAAHWWDDIVAT